MMIGLDGSTPEQERETLQELLALHPDTLRIYPLVVLKGTELAERVQNVLSCMTGKLFWNFVPMPSVHVSSKACE